MDGKQWKRMEMFGIIQSKLSRISRLSRISTSTNSKKLSFYFFLTPHSSILIFSVSVACTQLYNPLRRSIRRSVTSDLPLSFDSWHFFRASGLIFPIFPLSCFYKFVFPYSFFFLLSSFSSFFSFLYISFSLLSRTQWVTQISTFSRSISFSIDWEKEPIYISPTR